MRNMPGRNMLPGGVAVAALVVEENISTEGAQEFALIHTAEEITFVYADIPGAQGFNDALVGRG